MSPFRAGMNPESVQAAGELSSYEVQSTDDDLVTVRKVVSLEYATDQRQPVV